MINKISNISFKGYDVIPLRGFYMQGIKTQDEKNIANEMKDIAQKEGLDIFVNNFDKGNDHGEALSIWGQDNKAFVTNKQGKTVLCNGFEPILKNFEELNDFKPDRKIYMPRGGEYYLGYKENGDKWLIINSMTISNAENFKKFGDLPTFEILQDLFDVKPEDICVLTDFTSDIDETIRPIGYPNVLVNDYKLSLANLEKVKQKFPGSEEIYGRIQNYLLKGIYNKTKTLNEISKSDMVCEILKKYGFNPIKIGGRYSDDINYMNALAFQNNKNGISYITNSTKNSYPELEYLESLFEKDLREKIPQITDIYFVSGGKRTPKEKNNNEIDLFVYNRGYQNRNVIMDILANRGGGIHCMTAEIPKFDIVG